MKPPKVDETINFNPVVWWSTIAGICVVIIFGSVFVTKSYLKQRQEQLDNPRPGYLSKLTDFNAVNRDGQEVALSELEGKVWVAGYQYTDCPSGCLGMAAVMKTLHEQYGSSDNFFLVSISLNPAEDTPEKLDAWVKEHGVDTPDWWFVTGEEQYIRDYMIRNFKFFGVVENTDPALIASEGKYAHDQRLALVDRQGHVRGLYDVMHTETGDAYLEKLNQDIRYLMNTAEEPVSSPLSELKP